MSTRYDHVIHQVDDYLHGLLARSQAEYVERHCEVCPICGAALGEARKRFDVVLSVPPAEPSEQLIRKTLLAVRSDDDRQNRRWRRYVRFGLVPLAACITLLAGLHIYFANLQASPYELRVVGQTELLAAAPASMRVQVVRRDKPGPVPGIPVRVELKQGEEIVRLAGFTTDRAGTGNVRFQVPDWGDRKCELRVVARTPGGPDTVSRTVAVKRSWKLMLSTDKPVYQPGQTIHVRSLALRKPDLKPVAGNACTFTITDPKGNVVFKHSTLSSRYGIASADCPLATEIIEGDYRVTCTVGDTRSETAVEVKKYILPKFKVELDLDRPFYGPGDRVKGTVNAAYFFGKPVAGGRVQVEATASEVGERPVGSATVETDAGGRASFELRLPGKLLGRPQDGGDARIALTVKVVDSAGQEQSTSAARIVTSRPLRIEVIPESGLLVRNVPNTVYLFTRYADGRPARTRIVSEGSAREFPTDDLGLASIEVTPKDDRVRLRLRATDEHGLACDEQIDLPCGRAADDYLLRLDRAVYTGGQTARISIFGGGNEPVFVDFIKDGQILLTARVEMTGGKGEAEVDLPADLFGTIQVQSYRFGNAGLANRKSRVIYVEQARQVAVEVQLDRSEYRPGEQACLQLQLKDEQGRPLAGAVSLAAVDEAVFSVLSQRPGLEQTFFNLEQELLEPVYAIYPWMPDLNTSVNDPARRARFNQALFSRTARTAGGQTHRLEEAVQRGFISPRALDVLQYEELDDVLASSYVSDDLRQIIQGNSTGTFFRASYGDKLRATRALKRDALDLIKGAWVLLALAVVAVGIAGLVLFVRSILLTVLAVLGILLLVGWMMLPSLARARELSKRTMASASLREIDTAFSMVENTRDGMTVWGVPPTSEPQPAVRVREWFPETLLWRPEIITDDAGRASIDVPLADSITTWRLTGSAVTGDGRLGGLQSSIRVFQPFFVDLNLPVSLTRGDEVSMPVVVYNYLEEPQTVTLTLEDCDWFTRLDERTRQIALQPGDVRSIDFRIRAEQPGRHQLQITARAGGIADAVKRDVEIVPEGRRIEQTFSGALIKPAEIDLTFPSETIEGSAKAILRLHPSTFSQVVEGLDAIFRMPYGCFEQTSSTTYPNVLALEYLRRTGKTVPEVEAKARQYIHLGYQRLLTFEVSGGGFDWFGRPPANQTLTAYGLMEFTDMAKVHDVDPNLIERTRKWLLSRRNADGSWPAETHGMHEDPLRQRSGDAARLAATAYAAWAVFSDPQARADAGRTQDYILRYPASDIQDPYLLSLVCNALLAMDAKPAAEPYLDRLLGMMQQSDDGKLSWWEQARGRQTAFHGSGLAGNVETTASAALALMKASGSPAAVRGALAWLVRQKDACGTWHSTQATVLALRALIEGSGTPLGQGKDRRIRIACGDDVQEVLIPADQEEVVKQIDLTDAVDGGARHIQLADTGGAGTNYQLVFRYHVPGAAESGSPEKPQPLSVDIEYDRTQLAVGDCVTATATIANHMAGPAPMVILDLPIPPGFAVDPADFERAVQAGTIAKFETTARQTIVYLRGLEPGTQMVLRYRLTATMPVTVTAPGGRVYEYYNPDNDHRGEPVRMTVRPRA